MANNRLYYAIQQFGLRGNSLGGAYDALFGVQQVGVTTSFDLQQAYSLGQISIYDNIEGTPDVELTTSKVLDGHPLIFHEATVDALQPTLAGRSVARCDAALSIFDESLEKADGTEAQMVEMSGMYISSVGYNFPLDDNFSEDATFVGNDKLWKYDNRVTEAGATGRQGAMSFAGEFGTLVEPIAAQGVQRKENLIFSPRQGVDWTLLPSGLPGISVSGTQDLTSAGRARLSSISVSTDLGREEISELGRRTPYYRFATFPIEVTTDIEMTSVSGDVISFTEDGILTTGTAQCDNAGNLLDEKIRLATCEGTRISLGEKNKLSSVNYGGGDAGGGNVTVTYTYTNFNDFTVLHSGDPNVSGSVWWTNRSSYLIS